MKSISNRDDVIDSRDVIARIKELSRDEDGLDETEKEELAALVALSDEADGCEDWEYGAQLIRDSYFKEYAQEFAADIGAIDPRASWPLGCIDWTQAADELKMDYTSVDFDGQTYWVR